MRDIEIKPEFRDLIRPLSKKELEQLHASLDAGMGPRDPLVVWKEHNILLDGHHRYAYCKERGYEFDVREVRLMNEDSARNFIILNQLGRRNLDKKAASTLRGKLYLSRKKEKPNPKGLGGKSRKIDKAQSEPQQSTAEQVAAETGVSRETVKRDAKFAEAVEKLGIEADVISGKDKRSKTEIIKAATELSAAKGDGKPARQTKASTKPKWEKCFIQCWDKIRKLSIEDQKQVLGSLAAKYDEITQSA